MKQFTLKLVEFSGKEYVRVQLLDEQRLPEVKTAIEGIEIVKNVTNSTYSGKPTLNIHPDWMISGNELLINLTKFLDDFFCVAE